MFTQFKNIDSTQKLMRFYNCLYLVCATVIICFAIWKSYQSSDNYKQHIYILANDKALEAIAADRKENVPVEARDHIKTFHQDFFSLDPDDKVIQSNIGKALYLADESAKRQYDNLRESGYYANLIAGNISQQINVDSVALNMNSSPYYFRCYATEKLVRTSSTTTRNLVTQGYLRSVSRSDNNPHGFLIERWEILTNRDTTAKNP